MDPVSLSGFPLEILERILLLLPPADILRMKEVSNTFVDAVSNSQYLQYHIDLYAAGLIDNLQVPRDLSQRRERLHQYVDEWKTPGILRRYRFPLKYPVVMSLTLTAGQDIFIAHRSKSTPSIFLTRIPSHPSQEALEEWTLELQFRNADYLVSSRDDLVAAIENGTDSINIHLLNLLNGSPHEVPRKKVLPLDLGKNGGASVTSMQISSSRIALVVDFWEHNVVEQHKELIVWDWRTGNMVFRRSNNRPDLGGAISGITTIEFLEGTWLLAVSHNPDPQLLIIDTLVPKQYRRSWQILKLPPLTARGGAYSISTQCENSLARYPEFSVDPAQRNFAVFSKKGWTLVVPAELLKRCLNSVRANRHIWWDDWKKHVIAIYLPDTVTVRIVDMKALVLRGSGNFPENWGVEVYDLSKSAQKDMQAKRVGEERDARRRKVSPTPKWFEICHSVNRTPLRTLFMGNKVIYFSMPPMFSDEDFHLRILEIG